MTPFFIATAMKTSNSRKLVVFSCLRQWSDYRNLNKSQIPHNVHVQDIWSRRSWDVTAMRYGLGGQNSTPGRAISLFPYSFNFDDVVRPVFYPNEALYPRRQSCRDVNLTTLIHTPSRSRKLKPYFQYRVDLRAKVLN
jgi:hypothetical protein